VTAILGNWTSGDCVEFMGPLSQLLLEDKAHDLHRLLWARTIKRQLEEFFRCYGHLRKSKPAFEEIISVDASRFDPTRMEAYEAHGVAASFMLNRLMETLGLWRAGLQSAQLDTSEVDGIEQQVRFLKKPTLRI
jgi:hypothetical protein